MGKLFASGKYRSQIFLSISVAIMLTIVAFSAVVYSNARAILQKKEYESDSQFLYQVKYNITQMDSGIKNLSAYLFQNNDIRSIMYRKEDFNDMAELTVQINRLAGSVLSSNPYVDSICIYNRYRDLTLYIGRPLFFEDPSLKRMIESAPSIPRLTVIPRKIENIDKRFENVFTYFMYDTDRTNAMDGALIVNVKSEWFLDQIQTINMVDKKKGDRVFILDEEQRFINDENSPESLRNAIRDGFLRNKDQPEGFYESEVGGKNDLVTYVRVEGLGVTLLKLQPGAEVYKYLNSLKTTMIGVTLAFLLLTLFIALTLSGTIYRPVSNLIKRVAPVNSRKADVSAFRDEFVYLGEVYKQSAEQLDLLDKEKNRYRHFMKVYLLKKLFQESHAMDESAIAELGKEKHLKWVLEQDLIVCVLKIDDAREFGQTYSVKQQELIKFAVLNISTEMLSASYMAAGCEMSEDHVALAIGLRPDKLRDGEAMSRLLSRIQAYILQYYKISVTASVSRETNDFKEISKIYGEALNDSIYRFVLGRMSVISPNRIRTNTENEASGYPADLEERLLKQLKSGRPEAFGETLRRIFAEVSKLEYDNIMISLIRLADALKKAVDALMKSKLRPVHFHFPAISRKLLELETIDEFHSLLVDAVSPVMETDGDEELERRNAAIIDAVRGIVMNEYADPALCQDGIASALNISSRRLSRIFKDGAQTSIPEYIHAVRLDKALDWLESSNLSVYEIVAKVGIENESYFYSLFKKRFGTTPKEYTLQKKLKSV
ncbi:AraC family transcriptional regulator [Cohnella nanjingensis]|uniref:AraC family transcriptional regulator n=1 Tax=Cohnella nanjingensis TaxID=1387779 RepID=A0A7X0RR75_9BACL|nr:AraC family transcriptional regulator [Cohnella nanjingensis]MBB6670759.1 AraC family transcriptional regulator [Cohnella nanjingensis]